MLKERAPHKKVFNESIPSWYKGLPQLAKKLGAEVSFSGSEMKISKKEPGKDLEIYCDGTLIPRYKAEGYTLDEFKKFVEKLGILRWAVFDPDDKWPFQGLRIKVVRNPDNLAGHSWFP